MKTIQTLCLLTIVILCACGQKQPKQLPVQFKQKNATNEVIVPYSEMGGVKTMPVKLNGMTMDMIFDTGCSGLSISSAEYVLLCKNGKITKADIIGMTTATIADGSTVEEGLINIATVEIVGENGNNILLHNVETSVVLNMEAPVLLGNGVLDEVATVQIDNNKRVISFSKY